MTSPTSMFSNQSEENFEQGEMLPFDMTHLTPAIMEEARTELNETDEVRVEALKEFRKLIDGEKNLNTRTDDLFLLAFLRSQKFNAKKAFKVLQNYWSFQKEYRQIYLNSDVHAVLRLFQNNIIGLLPFRDRNGCLVVIVKYALWNPEQNSFEDIIRAATVLLNYAAELPATQIAGFRSIFDIRQLSWSHLKHFTPSKLFILIRSTQFCFPGRYKGIHVFSDSKVVKFISTILHPLLTSKLKKRVIFHNDSNLELIKNHIHPSILPAEFGGEAPEFDNGNFIELMKIYYPKILKHLDYGYKH